MADDPIVAEVQAIRAKISLEHGDDLAAICNELRRLQREGGREVVSFPPRPPLACDLPAKALPEPVAP